MKSDLKAEIKELYEAILTLGSVEECADFFDDLCTIKELDSMAQRLWVAKLLDKKQTFNKIAETTGASSATISRVNRCLMYGKGYKEIIDKQNN